MSSSFGQNAPVFGVPAAIGRVASVVKAGWPRWKVGGVTIDWNAVVPLAANYAVPQEGRSMLVGQKYLRYGTVLCLLTSGGKYAPFSGAMAADTLNGAVIAGGSTLVLTTGSAFIFPGDSIHVAAGGGTAEDIIVGSYNAGTKTITLLPGTVLAYGHADTTAVTKVDGGRQTLSPGKCYILDKTVILGQDLQADHPAVFDGLATVFASRIASDISGGVTGNPTIAQLRTAFPSIGWDVE